MTPADFEKALTSAGAGKTGTLSLKQFVSTLDIIQNGVEAKLAEDDDSVTDALDNEGGDEEEEEAHEAVPTTTAGKAKPKPKAKGSKKITDSSERVPSAAEVAVSLASGGVEKNDTYDYSAALSALEALHTQQTGKRKGKAAKAEKVTASSMPAAVSAQSVATSLPSASTSATNSHEQDEDEDEDEDEEKNELGYSASDYPESVPDMTEEDKAREVYDTLRKGRPSAFVGDFLRWNDVVELLDCGALTKEKLAAVLGEAGITVDKPDKTVLPFEKV